MSNSKVYRINPPETTSQSMSHWLTFINTIFNIDMYQHVCYHLVKLIYVCTDIYWYG